MSSKIRIAICGGGLAGASLFHALLKSPHLDTHIFESAPEFKEAGLAVGLTRNAQAALSLIGSSAVQAFSRAGAVSQRGAHLVLAQGPDAGETVGRIGGEDNVVSIVHRAAFLKELLDGAPGERMHASKKLKEVVQTPSPTSDAATSEQQQQQQQQQQGAPVTLVFTDGTQHPCDLLIGADGIHSTVRKFILGADDPAASPVPAGWWTTQLLKPFDEVAAFIGKTYLDRDKPGEVARIGDGAVIFHSPLSDGNLAQFVIAAACEPDDQLWQREVAAEEIREVYAKWPADLVNAVEKLVCDKPSQPAFYLWEHLPACTYVRDNVCVVGDAAHATTPWQGSGAGMSIEDSMILSTLLNSASTPAEANVALEVYDSVRRERTQRVVESSKGTGRLAMGLDAEAGLDAEKLRERFLHRWDFILDMDVEKHQSDALKQMEALLKAT